MKECKCNDGEFGSKQFSEHHPECPAAETSRKEEVSRAFNYFSYEKYKAITEVLNDIMIERHKQDIKWGEQNHEFGIWMLVLQEEIGEVCQEILNARNNNTPLHSDALRKELVQVAAVAVQMVEFFDRDKEHYDHMIKTADL